MNNLQRFLIVAVFSLILVTGCGSKSSSTDSGTENESTLSTTDCGKGQSCQGTYSTLSSDSKVWTGVCRVKQVDSGEWTKLWFVRPMNNCGFEWIRAQGSIGSDWAALASGSSAEFMVEHTGTDVFQLRRCENGGKADNTGCK